MPEDLTSIRVLFWDFYNNELDYRFGATVPRRTAIIGETIRDCESHTANKLIYREAQYAEIHVDDYIFDYLSLAPYPPQQRDVYAQELLHVDISAIEIHSYRQSGIIIRPDPETNILSRINPLSERKSVVPQKDTVAEVRAQPRDEIDALLAEMEEAIQNSIDNDRGDVIY